MSSLISFFFSLSSFPFLSYFLAQSISTQGVQELVVELRAIESCHSCVDKGVWLTFLSVISVLIDSGSSKPFGVLAWGHEARGAPSSARVMRAEGCRIW